MEHGPLTRETRELLFGKADLLERFLAKFIDLLIAAAFFAFPSAVGPVASATYILISDGLMQGQSLGKKIIGLKTITDENNLPCDYRRSIIRNAEFAILIMLFYAAGGYSFVFRGLVVASGTIIAIYEIYRIQSDERGMRFGDSIAGTFVVDAECMTPDIA